MNWVITNRQLRRELDRLQMRDAARCSEHQHHVERLQARISGLTAEVSVAKASLHVWATTAKELALELKKRDERAGLT